MADDRRILGSLVRELRKVGCLVCGCAGDSCSLETGEKCVLPDVLGAVCSNPRCVQEAHYRKKRYLRERLRARRAGAAGRKTA